MLETVSLRKEFKKGVVPVKDVSLRIKPGEFLTLLGPSGCGKSTVLRMIAGLETPTSGRVLLDGKDITSVPARSRNLAMVFQSYALYPHLSIFKNIATPLTLRGVASGEVKERVTEVAERLGLDPLLDRKPGALSGGQRQRVALARALIRRPAAFLLDEPLSNLDALLREQVRADLKTIFSEQDVPVVYVTHDQVEAMTLSTRVAVLSEGLVQQLSPPDELYLKPANRFVASFVGTPAMNLHTLPVEAGEAIIGSSRVELPEVAAGDLKVSFGLRPEDISLADEEGRVRGEVLLNEHLGQKDLLYVKLDDKTTLRALVPPRAAEKGENVGLTWPDDAGHLFKFGDGERLN